MVFTTGDIDSSKVFIVLYEYCVEWERQLKLNLQR